MKRIPVNEIYETISQFLEAKGVELKDGSYTQRIRKSCSLLTEAVNVTQHTVERAKRELDRRLDRMRQTIHEKTAPKTKPPAASAETGASPQPEAQPEGPKPAKPRPISVRASASSKKRTAGGRRRKPAKA